MLEISVDEFMDKAAALKGNVSTLIAQFRDDQADDRAPDDDLEEAPEARPLQNNLANNNQDPDFEVDAFAEEPPRWLVDNAVAFLGNGTYFDQKYLF